MKKVILILLTFAALQLQGQTDREKELIQIEQLVAEGNLNDSEMFDNYITLIRNYVFIDVEKTHYYINQTLSFVQEKKNIEWESKLLTRMGAIYGYWGSKDTAIIYLDKALMLIEGKDLFNAECYNYEERGNFYRNSSYHEKALNAYFKAIEINEKDKTRTVDANEDIYPVLRREISLLINISGIYGVTFNFNKIQEYLQRAKKIIDENPNYDFKNFEYKILGFLSEVYMQTNQMEEGYQMAQKFYEMSVEYNDNASTVQVLKNISYYHRTKGNLNYSLKYAKQSLDIAEHIQIPELISIAYSELTKTYIHLKDFKNALKYAEYNLSISEEDDFMALEDIYADLIIIYASMGNVKKAEKYASEYRDIISKMSDENLHNALQEMEVKYDVQQKELEILQQQTEIRRHKTLRNFYITGLVATGLFILLLIYIVMLRTRRSRELAEMNTVKDKFFNIISHDLKNPAIAQRDAVQLLSENIDKWDINISKDFSQKLLKSSNGLVELLKNLLNWAQIQTGRKIYNPVSFNLISALQPDLTLVKGIAEQKNITFTTQLPPTVIISGDENMLTTVVRNLLTNAVKFTDTGGTVTFDISDCRDKACLVSTKHTISITDTGTGMTSEQLQNLFRLDRQKSKKGTAGEQGTGLGLIVCRELLEKHGSTLHIESEVGKGSRIWFEVGE